MQARRRDIRATSSASIAARRQGMESFPHSRCSTRSTSPVERCAKPGREWSKYPQVLRSVQIAKHDRSRFERRNPESDRGGRARQNSESDGRVLRAAFGHGTDRSHHGRERPRGRKRSGTPSDSSTSVTAATFDGTVSSGGTDTHRHVFFVSDSTGITVETLGNALLSQFDHIHFITTTIPFVTDEAQAAAVVERIDATRERRA